MRRGLFGLKSLRAVLTLLGVVLLWAGPALAYSISGTITNNTGNTGRVYLKSDIHGQLQHQRVQIGTAYHY